MLSPRQKVDRLFSGFLSIREARLKGLLSDMAESGIELPGFDEMVSDGWIRRMAYSTPTGGTIDSDMYEKGNVPGPSDWDIQTGKFCPDCLKRSILTSDEAQKVDYLACFDCKLMERVSPGTGLAIGPLIDAELHNLRQRFNSLFYYLIDKKVASGQDRDESIRSGQDWLAGKLKTDWHRVRSISMGKEACQKAIALLEPVYQKVSAKESEKMRA